MLFHRQRFQSIGLPNAQTQNMSNPISSLSSSYLETELGNKMNSKRDNPSSQSAAPANSNALSPFAQMLSASPTGNASANSSGSLSGAMSSFHASGIKDQD
jgi:hypothetical protein